MSVLRCLKTFFNDLVSLRYASEEFRTRNGEGAGLSRLGRELTGQSFASKLAFNSLDMIKNAYKMHNA